MKRFWGLLCGLGSAFAAATSFADSINIQTFNPPVGDEFVFVEDAFRPTWPKTASMYFGANYNFLNDPLVSTDANVLNRVSTLVQSIQTLDLSFGMKVADRLALFIGAPVINVLEYPGSGFNSAIGDLKFLAKIRLTSENSPVSVAFIPEVHVPTGSADQLTSDSSLYLSGKFAVEHDFGIFDLALNLGFISAPNSTYENIDFTKRIFIGLGTLIPLNDRFGFNVEFVDQAMLPETPFLNPNELYAGVRYQISQNMSATGGASIGALTGPTGQDWRVVLGFRYVWYQDVLPAAAAPAPTPAPTPAATPAPTPVPEPIVVYTRKKIEVLKQINFDHNSADLTDDAEEILDQVADVIIKHIGKFKKIMIDGHTNSLGTDEYNLKLSLERSKSVKRYLVSKKVPENLLEARGFGERLPRADEKNPDALDINRRVEFIVVH